jgi:hypothetical protein
MVQSLKYSPDGPEFLHRVEDVFANDLGFLGVHDELLGLLFFAVAEDVAAVPEPVSGSVVEGCPCPLPDHEPLVLRRTHVHVVGEEVGRGASFVPVVEKLKPNLVLVEEGFEVAEVDRVAADPVHFVGQDQVDATSTHISLESLHLGPVEVFPRPPGLDVVGDGPDGDFLLPPLLDVPVRHALLGFQRCPFGSLLLGRDADVDPDPKWSGAGTLEQFLLEFHRSGAFFQSLAVLWHG